ncbi:MAG: hypothetical protein ACI9HK_006234 [Pirellulaceae bacterium]
MRIARCRVLKRLREEPDDRLQTAAEVSLALTDFCAGADLQKVGLEYCSPMQTTLENGADRIVYALLNTDLDLNFRGTEKAPYAMHLLCRYVRSAELSAVFLDKGGDPTCVDEDGETPRAILEDARLVDGVDDETDAMTELLISRLG